MTLDKLHDDFQRQLIDDGHVNPWAPTLPTESAAVRVIPTGARQRLVLGHTVNQIYALIRNLTDDERKLVMGVQPFCKACWGRMRHIHDNCQCDNDE